jgi:hypothetical protein
LAYANSSFIAIGGNSQADFYGVATSPDGVNWAATPIEDTSVIWSALTYDGSRLVAIGSKSLGSASYISFSELTSGKFKGTFNFLDSSFRSGSARWTGASDLNAIYTTESVPTSSSKTYDNTFYEIRNAWAANYASEDIISEDNLFTVEDEVKYNVGISYSENEETQKGTYTVTKTSNFTTETVLSVDKDIESNLSNRMSLPTGTTIGKGNTYTKRAKYVALSEDASCIATSEDAINWNVVGVPALEGIRKWYGLDFNGETFLAINYNGHVCTSADGVEWTLLPSTPLGGHEWGAVCHDSEKFVAISRTGWIARSLNKYGTEWTFTPNSFPTTESLRAIAYGNGEFVAISNESSVYTSEDGIAWNGGPIPELVSYTDWAALAYGNGVFVALTTDGHTSTSRRWGDVNSIGSYNSGWKGLYFDDLSNKFIALRSSGIMATSADGISWTIQSGTEGIEGSYDWYSLSRGTPYLVPQPFTITTNLLDWNIKNENLEWTFGHIVDLQSSKLIQYYRTPTLTRNQYSVKDICNLDKTITFVSDTFEGDGDLIDFSYEKGFTLCIKVDLQDTNPKVILYKSNLLDDVYFSLTFINQTLEFVFYTQEEEVVLTKELSATEYASYVNEPILLSIVVTPSGEGYGNFQMFKNNEPITETVYGSLAAALDPSSVVLSNYKAVMPTYEVTIDGETIIKTVEPIKCIEDIVVMQGTPSEEDLVYINNLFDTNY